MINYYERRYIDDRCLKGIKKDYCKDPRYPHIPQNEKENILVSIRYSVSREIFSNLLGIDGDHYLAKRLRFLSAISSKEKFKECGNAIRKWLWCCIKKDVAEISIYFTEDKVFIPQGDDQKALQAEYLDMISDATQRLIQQVVDNFDAIDTSYITDEELAEITARYKGERIYPGISDKDKERICWRLRHRVAMTIHEYSPSTDAQKKITTWLTTLDSKEAIELDSDLKVSADMRWLWSCIKQEHAEIASVFRYEGIVIPTEGDLTEQHRQYLAMIAEATKEIIAQSALSFDEVAPQVIARTDDPPPRSILKRPAEGSSTDQPTEDTAKGVSHLVTWGISEPVREAAHCAKKPRATEEEVTAERLPTGIVK